MDDCQDKRGPRGDTMSFRSFLNRLKLLRRWNFRCVICGCDFKDMTSVTIEHLVPITVLRTQAAGTLHKLDNLAPTHWRCNQLKGSRSLLWASGVMTAARGAMDDKAFYEYFNQPLKTWSLVPVLALEPLENLSALTASGLQRVWAMHSSLTQPMKATGTIAFKR